MAPKETLVETQRPHLDALKIFKPSILEVEGDEPKSDPSDHSFSAYQSFPK